jgi:hypothetical protein
VTMRRPRADQPLLGVTRTRLPALALPALALIVVVPGCTSDGRSGPTPTVTVTEPGATTASSPSAEPTATSDVQGRRFDLGTVARFSTVAGVPVVELDRWTLAGTTDSTIAREGLEVTPHVGPLYTNQNSQKTYSAPIANGARVVVNRCVRTPGNPLGLAASQQDAVGWLRSPHPETVLLVTYDDTGRITRLATEARC